MDDSWYQLVGVPGLMRAARGSYAAVIRADLAEAGFDDMPRNGAFMLALLIHTGEISRLTNGLGVRKKAEGDLIDMMVMRGYVERTISGDGTVQIMPTDRGRAAEHLTSETSGRIDAMLERELGPGGFAAFQHGLRILARKRSDGWTDAD
jgi:hypothetical protein